MVQKKVHPFLIMLTCWDSLPCTVCHISERAYMMLICTMFVLMIMGKNFLRFSVWIKIKNSHLTADNIFTVWKFDVLPTDGHSNNILEYI